MPLAHQVLELVGEPTQICFFNAATGYAFTIVLAGRALTLVSLPNITLTPALVAGLVRVFKRHRPGMVKMPFFFTSCVATATKLLTTSEHTFCFKPCSVARALVMAPLVMALPLAFMDFIGGSMVVADEFDGNEVRMMLLYLELEP